MDTQNYAERITLGQPHSVYTKVVKIFKERCLLRVQAWMHLFNGKFLIPHTIVVSQDYSVCFPCVGDSGIVGPMLVFKLVSLIL